MSELAVTVKLKRKSFDLEVDLTVPKHGVTALLGPSGSGKSTLLRILAGLEKPCRGRIVSGGKVWFDSGTKACVPPQKRNAGVVFQDYALFSHLTAAQNIGYGLSGREAGETVARWLKRLHIHEYRDRYPHQLSGGQRQRVALARALATEPDLLLLDEPFSALDISLRQHLRDELKSVIGETRCPVIMVTHDLNDARYLADRVAVLAGGRVHCYGATNEVFNNPKTVAAAKILGWQNFLPIREFHGDYVKGLWGSLQLPAEVSLDAEYLACISHQQSTADANTSDLAGRSPSSRLDVVSATMHKDVQVSREAGSRERPPSPPSGPLSASMPSRHSAIHGQHPSAPPDRRLGALATIAGEKCRLAIRSEHLRFTASGQANSLPVVVDTLIDLGAIRLIKCRLPDATPVYMHCAWDKPAPLPGAQVHLTFPMHYLRLLSESPCNRNPVARHTVKPAVSVV